eukprot:IDg7147t1
MVAEKNGVTVFRGSSGWVYNFMRRHATHRSVKLHGHSGAVCHAFHSSSMEHLPRRITEYNPSDVSNVTELVSETTSISSTTTPKISFRQMLQEQVLKSCLISSIFYCKCKK